MTTTLTFTEDLYYEIVYSTADSDWETFRQHSGIGAKLTLATNFAIITRVECNSAYVALNRSFSHFTIAGIPIGAKVTYLKLHVFYDVNSYTYPVGSPAYSIGFYNSSASITKSDFHNCMSAILVTHSITGFGWDEIDLSPALAINGDFQIVYRDGMYDYPDVTPNKSGQHYDSVVFGSGGSDDPYIEVIYELAGVSTIPAINTSMVSATLRGNLDTIVAGNTAACGFQWGRTVAYGNTTSTVNLTTPSPFQARIRGLTPNTIYHFRAFAIVNGLPLYGSDQVFITSRSSGNVCLDQAIYAHVGRMQR